jgi:dienelactone hydrolase
MKAAIRSLLAVSIAVLMIAAAAPYWSATALIVRAAGTPAWLITIARWQAQPVSATLQQIPIRDGSVRARIFRPGGSSRGGVLLVSGVHPDGIDEPRLIALARDLAGTGVTVVTPEIEDLVSYRLTAKVTDTIEDAALWIVDREDRFGKAALGMIGVSFSGGLSIVAAGRPALRDRVAFVLSFGGHGNLPRVLRYLCTGIEPSLAESRAHARQPHDYALAIVLHQAAEIAVPGAQVAMLRRAIETFLEASALNRTEPEKAAQLFEHARSLQRQIPEPAATLMHYVINRDVAALGNALLPHLGQLGQDPSLSPDRSPPPSAPVYLLHGSDDTVIPAVETELLAQHLQQRTNVHSFVSRFLTHVDVATRPSLQDTWKMIVFWKDALGEQ